LADGKGNEKIVPKLEKLHGSFQEEGRRLQMDEILQVRSAYPEQQLMEIIRKCRASGLSNKAYCREKGVSEKTFYYKLRKLLNSSGRGNKSANCRAEETFPCVGGGVHPASGAELTLPGGYGH